jgi:hypothetical protein
MNFQIKKNENWIYFTLLCTQYVQYTRYWGVAFWLGNVSSQKLFIKNNILLRSYERTIMITSNTNVSHHNTFVCVFLSDDETHPYVRSYILIVFVTKTICTTPSWAVMVHFRVTVLWTYIVPLLSLRNDPGNLNSIRGQMPPPVAEPMPFCRTPQTNKLRGFSPQSELYRPSDHRLSAKLVPTLADRGCRIVSATNPHGRFFRPQPLFPWNSFSIILMRLSGPRSRPTTSQKIW